MMKINKYDDSNENLKALTNTSPIFSEKEIIQMNLHWKNSKMISFGTWGKKLLHGFLPWHFWVNITLDGEIMKKYDVFIQKKIKTEKTIMFDDLYEEFLKLQISRFYGANSKTHYLRKDLVKKII